MRIVNVILFMCSSVSFHHLYNITDWEGDNCFLQIEEVRVDTINSLITVKIRNDHVSSIFVLRECLESETNGDTLSIIGYCVNEGIWKNSRILKFEKVDSGDSQSFVIHLKELSQFHYLSFYVVVLEDEFSYDLELKDSFYFSSYAKTKEKLHNCTLIYDNTNHK